MSNLKFTFTIKIWYLFASYAKFETLYSICQMMCQFNNSFRIRPRGFDISFGDILYCLEVTNIKIEKILVSFYSRTKTDFREILYLHEHFKEREIYKLARA